MFLLAKRDDKKTKVLVDKFIRILNNHLSNPSFKSTKHNEKLIRQVCNCLVYNLAKIVPYEQNKLIVSLNKNDYSSAVIIDGVKSKQAPVSYKYMRALFDALVAKGCVLKKGGYRYTNYLSEDIFESSTLELSEDLFDFVSDFFTKNNICVPALECVLEIRDNNKKALCFKPTPESKEIVDKMKEYNKTNIEHTVSTRDGQLLCIQGKRIFNRDLNSGGRIYIDGGHVQCLSGEERSQILIDGEEVVEVDFRALHPSLIATIGGHVFPKDFDPYGIKIEGYDPKTLRKLAKFAMLIKLNCKDNVQYIRAFNKAMSLSFNIKELYANKQIPKPIVDGMEIMFALKEHNFEIMHLFDEISGLKLQCMDSNIAQNVVTYFTQQDIVCIPIHDSFIVQKRYQQELIDVMLWSYKEVMGNNSNCFIDVK